MMVAHRFKLAVACVVLWGCGGREVASPTKCASPAPPAADDSASVVTYDFPRADAWASVPVPLRIQVDKNGAFSMEGETVADEPALMAAIKRHPADRGTTRVVIAADKRVPFDFVIQAMDALHRSGFSQVAFEVTRDRDGTATAGATSTSTNEGTVASLMTTWDCPFPADADRAKIDSAAVILQATVSENGVAETVWVLSDPGHGFGAAARACALDQHFKPARDANGKPFRTTTKPFRVRFER
jgi:biopolymer transport protein ExbD